MKDYKEKISYVIWGLISAALNIGLFSVLMHVIDYRIAEIVALVVTKIFCYVTNKLFVFKTVCNSVAELLRELCSFLGARLFTSILDVIGIIIMVEFWKLDEFFSKCSVTLMVLILNYILSKKVVFKKNKAE